MSANPSDTRENVSTLFEKLEDFLKSKTVIGEPMHVGNLTLIPVITVAFGLGTGGGDGVESKGNQGSGSGAGIGARINPIAIIVINGDKVDVLTIRHKMGMDKLFESVPDIVSTIMANKNTSDNDNNQEK